MLAQVRFARPTDRLDELVRFYRDGLGLSVIGGFEDHQGFDGVMLGVPGASWHLEFTRSAEGAGAPPGPEELIVLYFSDPGERDAIVARLDRMGHRPVEPHNPYWSGRAVLVPDPDGLLVALHAGEWSPTAAHVPARWRDG